MITRPTQKLFSSTTPSLTTLVDHAEVQTVESMSVDDDECVLSHSIFPKIYAIAGNAMSVETMSSEITFICGRSFDTIFILDHVHLKSDHLRPHVYLRFLASAVF